MTLAARAKTLSITVHAVDDCGALCGARPSGDWRHSTRLPVNCAKCLWAMSRPRYASCETVTAGPQSPIHIRLVGAEGICRGGNTANAKTLCGAPVGWDLGPAQDERGRACRACRACRDAWRKAD